MSQGIAFPTRLHVCQATIQFSLRSRTVWAQSLQDTLWIAKDSKHLQVDSKVSDQLAGYENTPIQIYRKFSSQKT